MYDMQEESLRTYADLLENQMQYRERVWYSSWRYFNTMAKWNSFPVSIRAKVMTSRARS